MKRKTLAVTAAFALSAGLLAGCDKAPERDANRGASRGEQASPGTVPPQPQVNAPTTPANLGQPSSEDRKEGANPVQGQVDSKERAQRKDFQQRGDDAGPTSPETQPRGG